MTTLEAARLVLQAGEWAENGKKYLSNMGDSVNISDLVHDLIRLSRASNVDVRYTVNRSGEKFYKDLLAWGKGMGATAHSERFSAQLGLVEPQSIGQEVRGVRASANWGDHATIRKMLDQWIPKSKFGKVK